MNHNLKEKMLADCYEYSLPDIADKMFLAINTVRSTEKRAIEKFKTALVERGIAVEDLLEIK
jgi:DNA-directed RNA polymerase specialized sigma24 family protein